MGTVREAGTVCSAARISVRNLTLRYGSASKPTLDQVNLDVDSGQMVALIGANGAGKSSLLRSMVRLVEPTAGTVSIGEHDVTNAGRTKLRAIRRDVGFVFQHFNLVTRLTAFDNVLQGGIAKQSRRCVVPAFAPGEARRRAMEYLDRAGLAEFAQRRVDTLSGGQQQRVAIARVLMQEPKVILADEPVASLDPVSGEAVMGLLHSVAAERGITVVAALHHIDLAVRYTERIVGLRGGRVSLDIASRDCVVDELSVIYSNDPASPALAMAPML
ncbi:MAG: phosphonate ABC transporter ATP-binding protein [Rhodococcus sp.]|nr:phosphonate ABC transporter ATP-binding protein [Rhodococcus sp. (in: high G+C Gram-positive bacteria)]